MVAGRLAEKNGYFYIVLSYNGPDGKRVQKWQGTGLPVKGNKKKADELLRQARRAFTPPVPSRQGDLSPDMLFSDYMLYWLEIIRSSVQPTTWSSYCFNVKDHIVPYFEPTGITLGGLQARHIQSFYLHERKTLKSTSVLRLHANLHKALKQAVKLDLIPGNPVDKVERPKPERYMAAYYTAEEMEQLFEAARGHRLELIIQFAAFYGLRRGEVLGLRWDAIDFAAGTFTICHTVTTASVEGKHLLSRLVIDSKRSYYDLYKELRLHAAIANVMHPQGPCIPGIARLFVNVNGEFFPCERVPELAYACIGNISNGFDVERIEQIMNIGRLSEKECKSCWALRLCSSCLNDIECHDCTIDCQSKLSGCAVRKKVALSNLFDITALSENGFELPLEEE